MSKLAFNINKYRDYLLGGSAGYANNLLTKGFVILLSPILYHIIINRSIFYFNIP